MATCLHSKAGSFSKICIYEVKKKEKFFSYRSSNEFWSRQTMCSPEVSLPERTDDWQWTCMCRCWCPAKMYKGGKISSYLIKRKVQWQSSNKWDSLGHKLASKRKTLARHAYIYIYIYKEVAIPKQLSSKQNRNVTPQYKRVWVPPQGVSRIKNMVGASNQDLTVWRG